VYLERLWPAWWLWLLAAGWALTLAAAIEVVTSLAVGATVFGFVMAVCAYALWRGAWTIRADSTGLRVGPVWLPVQFVGPATALDPDDTRHLRGVGADARAFTVLRGWIPTAVTVSVLDARDPTPYWLVSTRRPQQLAAALAQIAPGANGR